MKNVKEIFKEYELHKKEIEIPLSKIKSEL